MSKRLMRTTEIFRADTEKEAQAIIAEAAEQAISHGGELTKKIVELKQKKAKGEVIDEAYKVTTQIDWSLDFWKSSEEK